MKKVSWCRRILWCAIALMATISCTEENLYSASNNGDLGTLTYDWSDAQEGDTVYLFCNQTVIYSLNNSQRTITPKAIVKIWPEQHIVEYAAGMNPVPRYQKTTVDKTYHGSNPYRRVINQHIYLHDGSILHAEISYELYSYMGSTREQFFPHVEFSEMTFNTATAESENGYFRAKVTLNVPWSATDNSGNGTKEVTASYLKKRVQETDVVLATSYTTGVEWTGINTFKLYLDKYEVWQMAGDKTTRTSSPELRFDVNSSDNKSIEATNFNFNFTRQSSHTTKQKIDAPTPWQIKKGLETQTLMFTNGTNYFEDTFSYPIYEASITQDGQTFGFDLDVMFNVTNNISYVNLTNGQNISTATLSFASHSFSKTVTTQINKIEDEPIVSGKGKIIYYSVTAVFDPAEVDNDNGSITKKCVLVKYENGYDWGICAYEDDFPSSFTYTESSYGAFNSAAKKTKKSAFELARVTETDSAILWYDGDNNELSGISGLECLILGWKNKYNDKFSAKIESYSTSLSNNGYTLTLTAPDGVSHVFDSRAN